MYKYQLYSEKFSIILEYCPFQIKATFYNVGLCVDGDRERL